VVEQLTFYQLAAISIAISTFLLAIMLFLYIMGRSIRTLQAKGLETNFEKQTCAAPLAKAIGIILLLINHLFAQAILALLLENMRCEEESEDSCGLRLRTVVMVISGLGLFAFIFCIFYTNLFLTRHFPDRHVPWAGWDDLSSFYRAVWKILWALFHEFLPEDYNALSAFVALLILVQCFYEKINKPPLYNRLVHVVVMFCDSNLLVLQFLVFLCFFLNLSFGVQSLVFSLLGGLALTLLQIFLVDKKKQEVITKSSESKNLST